MHTLLCACCLDGCWLAPCPLHGTQAWHQTEAHAGMQSTGDQIVGNITVVRRKDNHRLMEVHMHHTLEGTSLLALQGPQRDCHFHIE